MVYASEFKYSICEDLYMIMNPDLKSKNKVFKHIKLKEILKLRNRAEYLKLFQNIIPEAVDFNKEAYISSPIECMLETNYELMNMIDPKRN